MTAADLAGAAGRLRRRRRAGPVDLDAFKPGVTVVHPEYGLGRIVAIEGEGSGRKGRVAFAVGPARTFVLAKSPLRPGGQARRQDGRSPRASRPAVDGRS